MLLLLLLFSRFFTTFYYTILYGASQRLHVFAEKYKVMIVLMSNDVKYYTN